MKYWWMRPPVTYWVLDIGNNKETDIIGCWYFLLLLLLKNMGNFLRIWRKIYLLSSWSNMYKIRNVYSNLLMIYIFKCKLVVNDKILILTLYKTSHTPVWINNHIWKRKRIWRSVLLTIWKLLCLTGIEKMLWRIQQAMK